MDSRRGASTAALPRSPTFSPVCCPRRILLPQVRAVCRRQFFVRTVGSKVAAQQETARRAAPPPPPPQRPHEVQRTPSTGRPVVLPQGDSWASAGIVPQQQPPPAQAASSSGASLWGFAR